MTIKGALQLGSLAPTTVSFLREAQFSEVQTELRVPADIVASEFRNTSRFVDVVEYSTNASSDEEPQLTLAPKCARRPPRMLLKNLDEHFWREVSAGSQPATARTGPGSPPNRTGRLSPLTPLSQLCDRQRLLPSDWLVGRTEHTASRTCSAEIRELNFGSRGGSDPRHPMCQRFNPFSRCRKAQGCHRHETLRGLQRSWFVDKFRKGRRTMNYHEDSLSSQHKHNAEHMHMVRVTEDSCLNEKW